MLPKKSFLLPLSLLAMVCGCSNQPRQEAQWNPSSFNPVVMTPASYNPASYDRPPILIPTPPSVRTGPIPIT